MSAGADRNLIFGLLALQLDFLTREQLFDALHAGRAHKDTPLSRLLCECGVLDERRSALLEGLVVEHLAAHGDDPPLSLAALRVESALLRDLQRITDGARHDSAELLATPAVSTTPGLPVPHLDSTALEPEMGPPAPDSVPPWARYRRLREHARGGLGEVFVAHDEELHREVALKEIQNRYADHPDVRLRFLREAEVTGNLEHPGIVPVYGLGRYPDGRPFYAMRLVRGESMQEAISRFHQADDNPHRDAGERRLALRDLLARFVGVCNAVAYAHDRGVLHLDLKPANAMLGGYGETLVVDWGLARLLDLAPDRPKAEQPVRLSANSSTALTVMGQVVGTPAFMPPEQAAGQHDRVGVPSDVFALGAMLYCLITGQPPYTGEDVLAQALRGDVVPARQRKRSAPPALEAICARAMAAKPEDRYGGALELAGDVQRWLADEPVVAYREPWVARAGRWLRRHRTLASTAAAALLVALALGGYGAWRLVQQAAQQRRGVESALQDVARLQQQARWAEARVALDGAQSRLAESGPEDLRLRLDQARHNLDLVARLDAIRLKKAVWGRAGFDKSGADRGYEEAFLESGLGEVGGDASSSAARVAGSPVRDSLVAALDDWAACVGSNRPRREWLLEVARRADPDPWRDRARDPAVWDDRAALARLAEEESVRRQSPQLLVALGGRLLALGGNAERLLRAAQEQYPEDFWVNFSLGNALRFGEKPGEAVGFYRAALAQRPGTFAVYINLGIVLSNQGKHDEAVRAYRRAIDLAPELALAHANLALVLMAQGKPEEAAGEYRKAIALDPNNVKTHAGLGNALKKQGKLKEAISEYRRAISLAPREALPHHNLGRALKTQGRLEEAVMEYRKTISLDPKSAGPLNDLGLALLGQGKRAEAISAFRKAVTLDPKHAGAHNNLGGVLHSQGKLDEATEEFRKAIALDPKHAPAYRNLGIISRSKGKWDEAIVAYRQAIDLDPRDARTHHDLGNVLAARGKRKEAIDEFRKAVALDPKDAKAHGQLGIHLAHLGQLDEAIAEDRKAIEIDPGFAEAHCNLGFALQSQGRFSESLKSLQRGHALGSQRSDWPHPSAMWVRRAERLVCQESELLEVLSGKRRAQSAAETIGYVPLCIRTRRYASAARLSSEAFAAEPALADDPKAAHRLIAACCAARAAAGQGADAPEPQGKERSRLRRQALGWLRADLVWWGRQTEKGTAETRTAAQQALQRWQQDADLAGVRDAAALEKLPEEERVEWKRLWADVAALVKKCGAGGQP